MTKRDDQVSLVDMLIYAEEAVDMLGDASLDAMVSDRKMQLALQRLVEIVGEAASRVSEKARRQHPAYLRQILQEPALFQSSIG
ncbi:MAG: hypothetical protein F4Y84_19860 [Caldilineaceae bacterium SB0665_bin_25]|nr:hypothetical protein [Caldilineaceae bacterium]MXZ22814.1 hypothetical protein [Caldilineaceae bacterium SB0665_bin_25]